MKARGYIMLLFGLVLLLGGYIGHLKAGSLISLISGIVCGVIAIGFGVALLLEKSNYLNAAKIFTGLLILFFAYRFSLSYNFFPAGLMTLLSTGTLLFLFGKNRGVS